MAMPNNRITIPLQLFLVLPISALTLVLVGLFVGIGWALILVNALHMSLSVIALSGGLARTLGPRTLSWHEAVRRRYNRWGGLVFLLVINSWGVFITMLVFRAGANIRILELFK